MNMQSNHFTDIFARDLQPGMIVPLSDKTATVRSVTAMDGKDGRRLQMISDVQPTSIALRIEFIDHETVIAHPWAVVIPAMKNRH